MKNEKLSVADIAALLQARCEKLTDIPEKVDFFDALPDYSVDLFTNKKSKTAGTGLAGAAPEPEPLPTRCRCRA